MKINAAVIGVGAMGKSHARNYSCLSNADLVAVCDSDAEKAKAIAKEYNANYYTDCSEMLKKEEIDAVSVCVPTKYHKKTAIGIIKNKINVLVEKPIAATVEEARGIINEAKENNVKLMVGHIERFNPVVIELKKRIARNELGKIYKVNCIRLSPFPQRVVDVGVIVDLAVHEIDVLRHIVNSEIARLYAETAQRIHSTHEDLLIGTIRFRNNVLGVINANWLTPKKVREITITGEKGMFAANYLTQEMDFYENEFTRKNFGYNKGFMSVIEGKRTKIEIEKKEPLKTELNAFIECIQHDKEPLVTGKDGLDALFIAQKFLESAKTNKVISM